MELVKDTEMEAAWQVWQARPPQPSLTVVVKATYALVEEGVCALAETQALPTGDEHVDDDAERGLRYPSDLEWLKPQGECFVIGSVHAYGEATQTKAAVEIGPVKKQLAVLGDRAWRRGSPTAPASFERMPLIWERAFGGPGSAGNPVGRGLAPARGEELVRLPNLEDPARLVMSTDARPAPVGLGPIARSWPARMRHAGTYDEAWRTTRYPWFPADLDWRYFLAAPPDQRVDGFWRGDETIALANLHPSYARVRCALPGHTALAFLVEDGALRDVGLRLDTITIDADEGLAYCVWRGVVEVSREDLSDVTHLYVTHAAAGERVDARARYDANRAAAAAAEAELEAEVPWGPGAPEAAAEVSADAVPADEAPADEAPEPAPSADEPGAAWAHLDQAMTLRGDERDLSRALQEAMAARQAAGLKSVFDDALGLDRPLSADRELTPEELLELEMMASLGGLLEDASDPRRDEVRRAVAAGESLRGRDLSGVDLSGVGLVGADLRGAILTRANLSGAHLERCQLDGATLVEAELSLASFDGCSLREADLTGARAHRVRWHDTALVLAAVGGCYLREARFMSVDLTRAELGGSDLSEADLRDCRLVEADLSGCLLERAVFTRCELLEAWLEGGVRAREAVFDGCDATLLRASEGADLEGASFKKAVLDGARFGDARLRGASFQLARLSRADFSGAFLHDASLMGCDLRMARFDGASAVGATFVRSNLMQARFADTNLSGADLRGANLYQAELLGARLDGARVDLANLDGTRYHGAPT